MQSGAPYSFVRPDSAAKASEKSLNFARRMRCSKKDDTAITKEAIKCLRELDVNALRNFGSQNFMHSIVLPNPTYGTNDGFLEDNVRKLLTKNRAVNADDVMIGTVNDEGEDFVRRGLDAAFNYYKPFNLSREDARTFLRTLFHKTLDDVTRDRAVNYYLELVEGQTDFDLTRHVIYRAYADLYVYCPTYFMIEGLRNNTQFGGRLYAYHVDYKAVSLIRFNECHGVCHGDENALIFGLPFDAKNGYGVQDKEASSRFIEVWSQFAKDGHAIDLVDNNGAKSIQPIMYSAIGAKKRPTIDNERYVNCRRFWRQTFYERMK